MDWISGWKIFVFGIVCFFVFYELSFYFLERVKRKRSFVYFSKNFIEKAFPFENAWERIVKKQEMLTRVRSVPIIGWTMIPNSNNGVVWTDRNGFRNDNLELQGKTVVAVFGGSVALGSMASNNNKTICGRLQHYLQQEYGERIVVLNLAQSSFTQIQAVSLFSLVLKKLNIKVSVFIEGHNDIGSVFYYKSPGFYGFVGPVFGGWKKSLSGVIVADTFVKTAVRFLCRFFYIVRHTVDFCRSLLYGKSVKAEHVEKPNLHREIAESFAGIAEIVQDRLHNSGRFALMTLQPIIYDDDCLSDAEKKFLQQFSHDRVEFFRECYKVLKKELYTKRHTYYFTNKTDENVILADFTRIRKQANDILYADDCHFGDYGNDLYAWNIFNVIKHQGWLDQQQ